MSNFKRNPSPHPFYKFWNDLIDRAENLPPDEYRKAISRMDWFPHFSEMNLSDYNLHAAAEIARIGSDDLKKVYNEEHAKRYDNESFYPKGDPDRNYSPPFDLS